jgi:hypothetical protein
MSFTAAQARQHLDALNRLAREDFGVFRRVVRPDMLWGWWLDEIARELQQFYIDLLAGRRPKLALMAPAQHGKSWTVRDFIVWVAGRNPDLKTLFASYSDQLGVDCNRHVGRTIKSATYHKIFPELFVDQPGWQFNASHIEYCGFPGSFRNTTVSGEITGLGLDLGVIDDPVKGRAEANSKTIRDKN